VVEGELVSRQMRALVDMENSGMVPMLQQDKAADLARMYALFRRVDGGVDLLRQVGGLGVGRLRALVGLAAAVD
jgi:cullin 3